LLKELILLSGVVGAGTAGELCVSRAMKSVGEVVDFRPHALVRVLLHSLRRVWMWVGIALMATAFFALLGVLSFENVSFVVPVTALSYMGGAIGASVFQGERVSRKRWIGILLVCIGVSLVIIGHG